MIVVSKKKCSTFKGDVLVVLVPEVEDDLNIDSDLQDYLQPAVDNDDFNGKEGQSFLAYPHGNLGCSRLLFLGIGDDINEPETYRLLGGVVAKAVKKIKAKTVGLVFTLVDSELENIGEVFTEGLLLGRYSFERHKKPKSEKPIKITKVTFFAGKNDTAFRRGIKKAEVAAKIGAIARDMANEPGNFWNASDFAIYAEGLSQKYNVKSTILGRKECQNLNMGGLLAVNQGSESEPRMVIVEYKCKNKKAPTVLLVGKGLTFDSGGISLKPGAGMEDMKYDMCGGAAVLSAMRGIAEEQPNHVNVVAIVPATDNMPSGSAVKPGDVITCYNGKTVEVINTDAEGRLILADALAYGVDVYKPDAIVDLATLTGAVIVGLGHHNTGLLSNDDDLTAKVSCAGAKCGEPVWRLPLGKEYTKQLKSQVADLRNIGGKGGGTITAGAFLEEFVDETPWVHLDIAGTAWGFTEKSYIPKGPSGTGARTLLELIRSWK